MVDPQVTSSANSIQTVLDNRDVQSLALVGGAAAGGVIVAQEIADRVLPAVGMSRDPTNGKEFAASALAKAAVGLGAGWGAAQSNGLPLVALAFIGVGALGGAAADMFNAVQRTGLASEAPRPNYGYQLERSGSSGSSGGSSSGRSAVSVSV